MFTGSQHPDRLVNQEICRCHAQRRIVPEFRSHSVGMIEPCEGAALFRKRYGGVGFMDGQFC